MPDCEDGNPTAKDILLAADSGTCAPEGLESPQSKGALSGAAAAQSDESQRQDNPRVSIPESRASTGLNDQLLFSCSQRQEELSVLVWRRRRWGMGPTEASRRLQPMQKTQ